MMDINTALGMVERPLHGPSREWLLKMADAEDRCGGVTVIGPGIRSVMESNECDKCGIGSRLPSGVCDHCSQPVLDPPRDEVAELRRAIDEWRKLDETNGRIKAELERLKRQVAFVKRESILAIRDQRGRHIENKCLLCDGRWDVDCPEQHMENCPNEVAT